MEQGSGQGGNGGCRHKLERRIPNEPLLDNYCLGGWSVHGDSGDVHLRGCKQSGRAGWVDELATGARRQQYGPSLPSPAFQATHPRLPQSPGNSFLGPTPPCELLALYLMVTLGPLSTQLKNQPLGLSDTCYPHFQGHASPHTPLSTPTPAPPSLSQALTLPYHVLRGDPPLLPHPRALLPHPCGLRTPVPPHGHAGASLLQLPSDLCA